VKLLRTYGLLPATLILPQVLATPKPESDIAVVASDTTRN